MGGLIGSAAGGASVDAAGGADDIGGGFAPDVPPNEVFVSPTGNDANTGLGNWNNAKKTVTEGIIAVNALGGGTVNIANGSFANPIAGMGIDISGVFDLGLHPAGWVRLTTVLALNFIPASNGLGGNQGRVVPTGGTWTEPAIQVAGTVGGLYAFNGSFDNSFNSPGTFPAGRIGLSSPLGAYDPATTYANSNSVIFGGHSYFSIQDANTGNQPDTSPAFWTLARPLVDDQLSTSLTANLFWSNCSFSNNGAGNGPALEIGYCFWNYFFNQTQFLHINAVTGDPFSNCAVRYVANAAVSSYLQYFETVRPIAGGIYMNGLMELFANHVFGENMVMPMIVGDRGLGGDPAVTAYDVGFADSTPGLAPIQNNGASLWGLFGVQGAAGPATQINSAQTGGFQRLLSQGQFGVANFYAKLQVDAARRLFGPTTGPYPNVAQPFAWNSGPPTPQLGPDGRMSAISSPAPYQFTNFFANPLDRPVAGDYYFWSGWIQANGSPPDISTGAFIQNFVPGASADLTVQLYSPGSGLGVPMVIAPGDEIPWTPVQVVALGQWVWCWAAMKIVSAPSLVVMLVEIDISVNHIADAKMVRVPAAAGLSIDEVMEMALAGSCGPNAGGVSGVSPPLAPDAGMPAMSVGTKLAFWDATLAVWKYLDIDNGAVRVT